MKSILRFLAAGGIVALVAGLSAGVASADNGNHQEANNHSESFQTATAVSGDASASFWSYAETGDAYASNYLATSQEIKQEASNWSTTCDCNNSNGQFAGNSMFKGQDALAGTGNADAHVGSVAFSGDSSASNVDLERQKMRQEAKNVILTFSR